ncbi:hypothetical protein EC988_005904, partial [Linderina pennispora]
MYGSNSSDSTGTIYKAQTLTNDEKYNPTDVKVKMRYCDYFRAETTREKLQVAGAFIMSSGIPPLFKSIRRCQMG